jgi:hypothetical protein
MHKSCQMAHTGFASRLDRAMAVLKMMTDNSASQ